MNKIVIRNLSTLTLTQLLFNQNCTIICRKEMMKHEESSLVGQKASRERGKGWEWQAFISRYIHQILNYIDNYHHSTQPALLEQREIEY